MHIKNAVKTGIFSLVPLVILIVCVELLLTLLGVGQPFRKASKFWSGGMQMMQPDAATGYRPKPFFRDGMLKLNSLGLRDNELDGHANIKILALGDSCTFGWKVDSSDLTFPALIERKLNEQMRLRNEGVTVDVMNAGVPSYTVYQGLQFYLNYLESVTRWDIVLVSYGWNETPGEELDLEFALRNARIDNRVFASIRDRAKRFRSYNLLESAWYQIRFHTAGDPYQLVVEQYRDNYTHLVRTIRRDGAKAILSAVIIPSGDHSPKAERMKRLNAVAREIAAREGTTWLDLNEVFQSRSDTIGWYDEYHYDHNGDRQVADSLAAAILTVID